MSKNNYKVIKHVVQKGNFFYGKIAQKRFICEEKYFIPSIEKLLVNPDYYLENEKCHLLKNKPNDTTTVGYIEIDGLKLVIKRYNIKNFVHLLRKFWRTSKAMINWKNSLYLHKVEITTLHPIAMIEERFCFGLFRSKAYFISLYVDAHKAVDYFAQDSKDKNQWQEAMLNIIDLMQKLYKAKIKHDDLQCGNMLILDAKPLLLDLDHMKVYSKFNMFFKRAWQEDIDHFVKLLHENQSQEAGVLFDALLEASNICKTRPRKSKVAN